MTSRREFLAAAGAAFPLAVKRRRVPGPTGATRLAVPTASQLAWQRDELAMFLHFGVNTFSDREWGDGKEDPATFAPAALDARQWARTARAGGFRSMILTAKHHDGFCLWPTRTTDHSVARSGWRGGNGDVVRELVDACRAEGLKAGVYLSPWDRNAPVYGDSPRYNEMYRAQLTELLTNYGEIHEVWFDGANGEGPNGRRQIYDWPAVWQLVRRLQPNAVLFSDAGPDVRWIGNENGSAGETNWSAVDPAVVPYPGAGGDAVLAMLQHGDPDGTVWRPGETDVSIRPGWFYHPAEDTRVKSAEQLVTLFFSSVGRNSKLLLNVPPTREGLLHPTDVEHLAAMRGSLDSLFAHDLGVGHQLRWRARARGAVGELDLGRTSSIGVIDLAEDIAHGQVVARYRVEGSDGGPWRTLSSGTTIGYRKLDRFPPILARRVRLTIENAVATPRPVRIRLFAGE
jgi:alpha-L-fucosidase